MIQVEGVGKRYGEKWAVSDVSFTIQKGEVLGLLGRNGAGKTTTMNIITGYLSASSGRVLLSGVDILKDPLAVKRQIGYLPELPPLYGDMTVREYLGFCCEIKGVLRAQAKAHIQGIAEMVGVSDHLGRLIRNLSKGYKQRVGMAQALVGNPEVIILDEPTAGLDPRQIIEVRRLIKQLGRDHTVVLSSHILSEVEGLCERVVILNCGRVAAVDTLLNLQAGADGVRRIRLRALGEQVRAERALLGVDGVLSVNALSAVEMGACDFLVEYPKHMDVRAALSDALAGAALPILMMKSMDVELEDIFLKLTGGEVG